MRAFLAVALPPEVREAVHGVQRQLQGARADVKWVEPENLHVTMKFFGEIGEPVGRALEAAMASLAERTPDFTLALDQVGAFPTITAPRVLWVGVGPGREPLTRLAEAIEEVCRPLHVRRETRPFAAHVTVGRVRSLRGRGGLVTRLRDVGWTPPAPWAARALTLYESRLSSAGPSYRVVVEWRLRAA